MGYTAAFIQWGILLGGSYYLYQKITEKSKKPSNGKNELKSRKNAKVNKKKKKTSKITSKEEELVKADESQKKVDLEKPTSLPSERVKTESKKPTKTAYNGGKKEETLSSPPRKHQIAKGKGNASKNDDLQNDQNISSTPVVSANPVKQNEHPENFDNSYSDTPKSKENVKVLQIRSSDSWNNDDDFDDGFQVVSKSKNGRKSISTSVPQTKKQRQNQQRKEKFRELQEIADLEQRKKLAAHRNELEMNMKRSKVASPNRFSPSSFVAVGQAGSSSSAPRYDTLW
ncbi:uncharacterized protein SOCG_00224 [Schizosaccharomyces octosporus yFS286]|uniref:Uncharacterized protein n=1 Tax=Schizosaccharomyces octosporus (strain yFS286) TaxID=483514 RepID=S9PTJ5_SCHOY|nr:uncharacterized protein SOCG_00224 [Schizosaccharomyces octosporus yFS286]EPX72461.1 hypothetical protein SOCG_00224 [Schizosaccharomyces octosporus yFS286]